MDVHPLRAFLAVADELHFGRAAERLHVAQPPLSRTIKQLERELGTRLFDRSTRSVSLTASGLALLAPAREVLDAVRRAEGAVRSAVDGEVGLVRISFAGLSTHRIVAQLARSVRSRHPGITLQLSSQNFAQPAMRKVVDGETDVALGRWDVVPSAVHAKVVARDRLVVAVPDTHPFATARSLSIGDLAGEPFVSLPPHEGAVLPDRLRRLAHRHGFVPDVVQLAPDTQTALALVGAEVGCHLTLRSVARDATDPHVAFVEVDEKLDDDASDVHLRAAWRRADSDAALRTVLDALLELPSQE
ncbi:LysR substrate-binding domain-containing protein [Mumia qirimensis]|uniref:LysR substrate-binding domain-containing protein n=1 Tax=Mumia qirimensis TaxID=3234852 RepID=UPI00351D88AB